MIHILTGDNAFEIKARIDELSIPFIKEHGTLAVERIDGDEVTVRGLADIVQSMPFLVDRKLVIVSAVTNKGLLESIAAMGVPDSTELLVTIPKVDKRASYYKKIAKLPGFKNFDNSTTQNVPAWVGNVVKERGGTITSAHARYLVDRVGTDQLFLSNEINKLLSYDRAITQESINLLCDPLPQTSVFQLLDAAFNRDLKTMEKIYVEQRAQKVEAHAILGMIAWQLHALMIVKTAGDRPIEVIAKDAKLNPFVVRKSSTIARKLSLPKLEKFVKDTRSVDIMLKTLPVDADQAMQDLLLKLAS